MRDTQFEAWDSIQEKLPESRREVLKAIERSGNHGITTFEVAERLGWAINSVSGRITELASVALVTDSGRRGVNPSGKKAILWVVNKPPPRAQPELPFLSSRTQSPLGE